MAADRGITLTDLQQFIDGYVLPEEMTILEAGCGSTGWVKFRGLNHIVGIDISERQLERNQSLDVKIRGDIQFYDMPHSSYDVIVCWDVLEHLPRPSLALENFAKAVKKGGLIILALPNVTSLWGMMTKFTPHWFHVLFYRAVLGQQDAGRDDNPPFPTFLRWSLSPNRLKEFAQNRCLSVVFHREDDTVLKALQRRSRALYYAYMFFSLLAKMVTLGAYGGWGNSAQIMVWSKS